MQGPLTFFTKGWKCLLIVQGGSITKGAKDTFLYIPIFWIFLKDPFMKLFIVFSFFSHLNNKRTRNVFCWARLLFLIVIIGTITNIITFNIIIIVTIFILVNVIIIINIIKKRRNQNIRHLRSCYILSFPFFLIQDLRKNNKDGIIFWTIIKRQKVIAFFN